MTTTTHRTPHPTKPICPPWCAGHTSTHGWDGYQGWEIRTSDGGRERDHCEVPAVVKYVGVEVCAVERADHTLRPPRSRSSWTATTAPPT